MTSHPPPTRLRSLRGYRLFVAAQFVNVSSVGMQRIVQDWLVLELTDSPAAVGVAVALQFFPLLLVGPAAGVLADRHDKRRIVRATTTLSATLGLVLAVLALTGTIEAWHLYAVAVLLGLVQAVDGPARQALVSELVGDGSLRTAISTNNVVAQLAGMVAPAVGGVLIVVVGEGWTFALTAVLALAALALLAAIRSDDVREPSRVARARGQVREGLRYVASHPTLGWLVVLAGCLGAFGMNGPVVLAAFADEVWHTGSGGFGFYNSVAAVGAVGGIVLGARLRALDARLVVLAAGAFGAVEIVAALMPVQWAFVVSIALVGAATMLFITSAATLVQLLAPREMRGRVLAIYSPVLLGGHAAGGLLAGQLTEHLGVRVGLVMVGLAAIASAVVVGVALARRGVLRLTAEAHASATLAPSDAARPSDAAAPSDVAGPAGAVIPADAARPARPASSGKPVADVARGVDPQSPASS
ncbi:putative MFS family arabinose efflux permease [Sediminihabitans luteus]|uniref:Putative MFS family arabinose efflux permease n=1 Tax=Sediminihabitans luteus TaxID=1138585 RepID=A0A2M9D0A5_9CELL|nr:MFS transporter [Sediminihabitans luteus]PJJ77438.1 putative MFS family arabinose efflux permease [Sediminihabitans luteus]GII98331.1 MFS transporter [Sediminihabitans luteus]